MKKILAILTITGLTACSNCISDINGQQVFFDFDSAKITEDARKNLHTQANYLKNNPETNITIQGRCDERGSTEYNLALGALRAGNAAHVLIHEGIKPERIKTVSYGKENPLYTGTGEKVWSKNRNATTVIR